MRVLVKRGYSLINDLRFESGPVYIGRNVRNHVYLPDQAVSRQHAVLFTAANGTWMAQDLESANQTMLNNRPIARMPLHEGDTIGIADFTLEIHFEKERIFQPAKDQPVDLGDTLVGSAPVTANIYQTTRGPNHAIHLPPNRVKDFYQLAVSLFGQSDQEALVGELAQILIKQFDAYHIWLGLRETTSGPLTCHGGCADDGSPISLEQLAGRKIVNQAINDATYILLPNIADLTNPADSAAAGLSKLRSALAAPIVAPAGAYGVIYLDNRSEKAAYSNQDLEYLTLVSVEVAALLEHIG